MKKLLIGCAVIALMALVAVGACGYKIPEKPPYLPAMGDEVKVTKGFYRNCRGRLLGLHPVRAEYYQIILACEIYGEFLGPFDGIVYKRHIEPLF